MPPFLAPLRRPGPHLLAAGLALFPFLAQPLLARSSDLLGAGSWSRAGFLISVLRAPGRWLLGWLPISPPSALTDAPPPAFEQGSLLVLIVVANLVGWWLAVAASVVLGARFQVPARQPSDAEP